MIFTIIRTLRRWLRDLSTNDKAFKNPDLSDDSFLEYITNSVDFTKSNCPLENYRSVGEYFSLHASRRFFLAEEKHVLSVWSANPGNAEWCEEVVETALRWREKGVPVYTTFTFPIGHEDFWIRLQGGLSKDILYTVAPHRFYFAPVASLASMLDPSALRALHDTVSNWISHMESSNDSMGYLSDLTVAVRIASLCWSWHFLSSNGQDQSAAHVHLKFDILKILRADINYLISIPPPKVQNNHRILYWFGIWFGSVLFPELQSNEKKTDDACDAMLSEIMEQTYHDGGSYEHSLEYQGIIGEVAAAALLLCDRNGKSIPKAIRSRLHQVLRHYINVSGPGNVTPQLGDGTGLRLFSLSSKNDDIALGFRELLCTQSDECIPENNDSKVRSEWGYWILGGATEAESNVAGKSSFFEAPDTGLYCMSDSTLGVRLLFRTGPPPSSEVFAGHMHSDLLSIQTDADGHLLLSAGGTYSYRTQPSGGEIDRSFNSSRPYFMGPLSHNCLCLGELDQLGPVVSDFRPFNTAARVVTRRHASPHCTWIEAEIVGATPYAGVQRGIIHVSGQYWLIYDRLPAKGAERSDNTVRFQCADHVNIKVTDDGVLFTRDSISLSLNSTSDCPDPLLRCGDYDPPGGWVSTKYGSMVAASQVVWKLKPKQDLAIWLLAAKLHDADISVCKISEDGLGVQLRHQEYTDVLIINPSGGAVDWHGVSLVGQCIWQRSNDEGIQEVRWLGSTGKIRTGPFTLMPVNPNGVAYRNNSLEELIEKQ